MAKDQYIVVFRDDLGVMTWTSYDSKAQYQADLRKHEISPATKNPKTLVVAEGVTQHQALELMHAAENHVARALSLRTRGGGGYTVEDLVSVGMMPRQVGRMSVDQLRDEASRLMGRDFQSPGPETREIAAREGFTLKVA